MADFNSESMIDVFLYETNGLIDGLEELLLKTEKAGYTEEDINEVFRCMHTIKGSSAMMDLTNISALTHSAEDLFAYIREKFNSKESSNVSSLNGEEITDLVLRVIDFIKQELNLILKDGYIQTSAESLLNEIRQYSDNLKNGKSEKKMIAHLYFEDGCLMENIRAFGVLKSIEDIVTVIETIPSNLDDEKSSEEIISNGFKINFTTSESIEKVRNIIQSTLFLKSLKVEEAEEVKNTETSTQTENTIKTETNRNFVSVDVNKLDKLLDIVGELVISESMLQRDNIDDEFEKSYRRLQRMTDELQNTVMKIRMIPVSGTFHKMQRLVRDLSKKTGKDINFVINGENTEIDKRIIDNLSEPLIHIIRNAVDHGIEEKEERIKKGKNGAGKILLEAYNEGGEVIIAVFDDGKGLDKDKIVQKAISKGLINTTDITDNEAYNLITLPGFSTNEQVTELSGRGVGMDVVQKEIMKAGGKLYIESRKNKGTAIVMRYPLTLAIIDGVGLEIGNEIYIIPALNVMEIFTLKDAKVINTQGKEMIMLRKEMYPLIRLGKIFNTQQYIEDENEGQICLVNSDNKYVCLLVDRVLSKQKIVVKPMPQYILSTFPSLIGFSGCTITGDGYIRLILDVNGIPKIEVNSNA